MAQASETYWVVVIANGPQKHSVHIIDNWQKPLPGEGPIVHTRGFDDFLVAMGYRIVLSQLSQASLIEAIRKRK